DIDTSASPDDLADRWPLHGTTSASLRPSRQASALLARAALHRDALEVAGIHVGRSRLAVRAHACVYCGLCMYGCPYELIFNSAHLLPKLRRDPRFAYRPGVIVQRVVETGEGVAVCGIDKATGRPLRFAGQRAYLGAGAVNSTRIVLESLGAYDTPLEMADSCYFLVPWVTARGSRAVTSEPLHTLAQLFFEILDPAISTHTVHLQLYTYNDLYIGAIRKLLGPAYR